MNEHYVMLSIVRVATLGVGAQWLAWRLRLPAIILLAAAGLTGPRLVDAGYDAGVLPPPRLAGVPVRYGDILSEFEEESVELAHTRTVLAANRNDAYNALVWMAIAPEIGQKRVLQLALGGDAEEDPRALARPRQGDVAFDNDADLEKLWRLVVKGWTFARASLSDNYSHGDFRRDKPADAMEILIMDDENDVEFWSAQRSVEPEPGDAVADIARAEQSLTSDSADAPVG